MATSNFEEDASGLLNDSDWTAGPDWLDESSTEINNADQLFADYLHHVIVGDTNRCADREHNSTQKVNTLNGSSMCLHFLGQVLAIRCR